MNTNKILYSKISTKTIPLVLILFALSESILHGDRKAPTSDAPEKILEDDQQDESITKEKYKLPPLKPSSLPQEISFRVDKENMAIRTEEVDVPYAKLSIKREMDPSKIEVSLERNVSQEDFESYLEAIGGFLVDTREVKGTILYHIELPGHNVENRLLDSMDELENSDLIISASPVFLNTTIQPMEVTGESSVDGSNFDDKFWHLDVIQADDAWNIRTSSPNIIVAVIDTAFNLWHQDLIGQWWVNEGEYGGYVGIDDDGNGYIDDVNGIFLGTDGSQIFELEGSYEQWDFSQEISQEDLDYVSKRQSYGTSVASLIGAKANNEVYVNNPNLISNVTQNDWDGGTVGISWEVQIMPIRIYDVLDPLFWDLDQNGNLTATSYFWFWPSERGESLEQIFSRGIEYAINNGANIINMSFGDTNIIKPLNDLINPKDAQGNIVKDPNIEKIIFVNALGNESTNLDQITFNSQEEEVMYGELLASPNFIKVAATNREDNLSSYSNWGLKWADIAAPGGEWDIYAASHEWDSNATKLLNPPEHIGTVGFVNGALLDNTMRDDFTGTSAATPIVSGALALLLQEFVVTNELTPQDVVARMLLSSDKLSSLNTLVPDGRRLNLYHALSEWFPAHGLGQVTMYNTNWIRSTIHGWMWTQNYEYLNDTYVFWAGSGTGVGLGWRFKDKDFPDYVYSYNTSKWYYITETTAPLAQDNTTGQWVNINSLQ